MARNKSISITDEQMEELKHLAERHGCLWGGEPSVSRLIAAIADGEIPLYPRPRPNKQTETVLRFLNKCIDILEKG